MPWLEALLPGAAGCSGASRAALAGVAVAYLVGTALVRLPLRMQMLNAAALALALVPACGRTGVGYALLGVVAVNLAARGVVAAVADRDTRLSAKVQRWDGGAAVLGAVGVCYHLWSKVADSGRLRTVAAFVLLVAFFVPLVRAAPTLALGLGAAERSRLSDAVERAHVVYSQYPVYDAGTDTRANVVLAGDGTLWVTFAGTKSFENAKTDANVGDVHPEWACASAKTRVHAGFSKAYASVRSEILKRVRAFPAATRVVACGHSLGGALATLCAFDLACQGVRGVECVTFGAPPLGDELFAAAFVARVPDSTRVVTTYDEVPVSLGSQFLHAASVKYTLPSFEVGVNAHMLTSYRAALASPAWRALLLSAAPAALAALAVAALVYSRAA